MPKAFPKELREDVVAVARKGEGAAVLGRTTRHHHGINRRTLQVAAWDDTTYRWLGIDFDIDAALPAAQQLFLTVRAAQQDHGA